MPRIDSDIIYKSKGNSVLDIEILKNKVSLLLFLSFTKRIIN